VGLSTIAVTLCVSVAIAIPGCNEQELKTAAQAESYISKLAKGEDVSKWKFAGQDAADPLAFAAWRHKQAIADLGQRLREHLDAEWACDTVGYVEKYGEASPIESLAPSQSLPTDARTYIIDQERQKYQADESQVAELIDLSIRISKSELVKTVDSICTAAEQL
jgi:hypothetical protein